MSGTVMDRQGGEKYTYGDGAAISTQHHLDDDDDDYEAGAEKNANRNEITAIEGSSSTNNTDIDGSIGDRMDLSRPEVAPNVSNGPTVINNEHVIA